MVAKQLNAVIRLRTDTENNFTRANLVLQSGEVAIVHTPFNGIQIKIGDGEKPFTQLPYETFGLLCKGKLLSNTEFREKDQVTLAKPDDHILFLDITSGKMHYWDGTKYCPVGSGSEVPIASDTVVGIAKLYSTISGTNEDGSVTQKAINKAFTDVESAANNLLFEVEKEAESKDGMLIADFSQLKELQLT